VIIGDGARICTGAKVISRGGTLTIGVGSIVAANAVVESDIPPYSIAVGVPAQCKPLKKPKASYHETVEVVS
jgi:serine O-acetyltransferase